MKKQTTALLMAALALVLLAVMIITHGSLPKSVSGVLLGAGAGLLGSAISIFVQARYEARHPEVKRKNEIESKDERNQMIRWRAQARAGSIMQWLVLALAFVMILLDLPLWLTLVTVLVYMSYSVIWMALSARYQQEM